MKAHPDKPGGSEAHTKKLIAAWAKWLTAGRTANKGGRLSKARERERAREVQYTMHFFLVKVWGRDVAKSTAP